jgi:hypothetical protein
MLIFKCLQKLSQGICSRRRTSFSFFALQMIVDKQLTPNEIRQSTSPYMESSCSDLFRGESAFVPLALWKRQASSANSGQQRFYVHPQEEPFKTNTTGQNPLQPALSQHVPVTKRKPTVTYSNSR